MPDWQELSGHIRACGAESRENQDQFWRQIRSGLSPLDIRDNERLCAIALVKRLFPKLANETLGWPLDTSHWPSTVHVGAVPWIRKVSGAAPEAARRYAESVRALVPDATTESRSLIDGAGDRAVGDFQKLDANYYHRERVVDERLCPLRENAQDGARQELARLLGEVYEARDKDGCRIGPPSSFYALLLADGDRLGRMVAELGGETVGNAMARFTKEVQKIVRAHRGVTIYSGGDDVMAMLPVPGALSCAEALAHSYRTAFEARQGATLSAAVLFAHVRYPLSSVLETARWLLEDVAKDGNGRDSLAAAVVNPGGLSCQWVTTWQRATTEDVQSSSVSLVFNFINTLTYWSLAFSGHSWHSDP
jgi:CRISPR-associated protein Cmr2